MNDEKKTVNAKGNSRSKSELKLRKLPKDAVAVFVWKCEEGNTQRQKYKYNCTIV